MSHRTSAKVIANSVTEYGDPTWLTSMYVVFPKMILGERNRHRAFSLSDRSSRAVPPEKLIREVRDDPAMPAKFRARTKGMGGGDELTGNAFLDAVDSWHRAARLASNAAEHLLWCNLAKEIVNRPLDPFIRMHSLMTATRDGWVNFFGLRLDAAADPTIQVLAQKCCEAYKASTPKLLKPGEWHLPFADDEESFQQAYNFCASQTGEAGLDEYILETLKKLSAARCAHLSYNDLETGQRMTVERALSIYDKLVNSRPLHASPLEHQGTPDQRIKIQLTVSGYEHQPSNWLEDWQHKYQHGNFYGWRQARKMLPGEAVAPLPEAYQ